MANKKLKVLFVRGCRGITDITGGERYLLTLLEKMNPDLCEYKLVCITDPRTLDTPWLQELERRKLEYVSIPITNPFSLKDFFIVRRLAKEYQTDVIHSIDHRANLIAVGVAKLIGCASVLSFFGWTNFEKKSFRGRVYPWIDKRILKRSNAIIVDSDALIPIVDWGRKGPPVSVIHHGVSTQLFNKDLYDNKMKSHFFGSTDIFLLGMVGRIHPVKGQLDFLQVAGKLYQKHPNCRFLIIGDAPLGYDFYLNKLKKVISGYGMEKAVLITNVHTTEIPKVFAAMDILVAPSYKDSFSFTMIEGMSTGLPMVAGDVGGTAKMINNGERGILISPGDTNALEKALESLLLNQNSRARIGAKARQWVIDNCSIEQMTQKTFSVYNAAYEQSQE